MQTIYKDKYFQVLQEDNLNKFLPNKEKNFIKLPRKMQNLLPLVLILSVCQALHIQDRQIYPIPIQSTSFTIIDEQRVADENMRWIVQIDPAYYNEEHDCVNFDSELIFCFVEHTRQLDDFLKSYVDSAILTVSPDEFATAEACQKINAWHLEDISDQSFGYSYDTPQDSTEVFVLDTWVDVRHPDFEGRASEAISFATGFNTHGTHVAGLIAGKTFGVNKQARIVSVPVLDGQGFGMWSTIIRGLEFVYNTRKKTIINMSLSGPANRAIDQTVHFMAIRGWKMIVAAGNSGQDACNFSPARVSSVVTIGAYDEARYVSRFSNRGRCVDIYGPGESIASTFPNNQYAILSGTSMASPIVAGILSTNSSLTLYEFMRFYTQFDMLSGLNEDSFNIKSALPHSEDCKLKLNPFQENDKVKENEAELFYNNADRLVRNLKKFFIQTLN